MSIYGARATDFLPSGGLVMVVGNYGSGKTEVAVNMALRMSERGAGVSIADLDIVNPYFRCREARDLMEAHGIRVVIPPGAQVSGDLPIILPEIKGMLRPAEGRASIFDVGGDPVGARVLSSFREHLDGAPYELWQVINSRRPFTGDVAGCLRMRAEIEESSRLKVTGLIANSHLVGETTTEVILEGHRLAREVSEAGKVPVVFVTAMAELADSPELDAIDAPVFRIERRMLPPWLRACDEREDPTMPAARPVPLGRAREF
ncbi:MAG: cobalamin biosynthesis protein CbiA [Deltaproteobacteria bacterium]|nr:cobalamin biosynthesis protein CbiA [Deltaproteobacteria bacterium]